MDQHPTDRMKAAEAGLPRYTGKPCRICGNALRYTVNCDCIVCSRRRVKECTRRVRDKIREVRRRQLAAQSVDANETKTGGS